MKGPLFFVLGSSPSVLLGNVSALLRPSGGSGRNQVRNTGELKSPLVSQAGTPCTTRTWKKKQEGGKGSGDWLGARDGVRPFLAR